MKHKTMFMLLCSMKQFSLMGISKELTKVNETFYNESQLEVTVLITMTQCFSFKIVDTSIISKLSTESRYYIIVRKTKTKIQA